MEGWKGDEGSSTWRDVLSHYVATGRITDEEVDQLLDSQGSGDKLPKQILPAPRLFDDLDMLEGIFKSDTPTHFPIRCTKTAEVFYGFFGASGAGLGSMVQGLDKNAITVRIGVWSASEAEENSSNWREFANMVKGIREDAAKGKLHNTLLFLCTDNSTVESAVIRRSSSSPRLFELVKDLKEDQMEYSFMVHVIHVSGKRMISQGTDGVSRGDLSQALSAVRPIREQIPINLSALERNPNLEDWLRSWLGKETIFLQPSQWFSEAHDVRFDNSTPPPRRMYYQHGYYL